MESEEHNAVFVLKEKHGGKKPFDEAVAFGKCLVLHDVLSKQNRFLLKRNKSQEIPQKDM